MRDAAVRAFVQEFGQPLENDGVAVWELTTDDGASRLVVTLAPTAAPSVDGSAGSLTVLLYDERQPTLGALTERVVRSDEDLDALIRQVRAALRARPR